MKRKSTILTSMVLALALTLTACASTDDNDNDSTTDPGTETTAPVGPTTTTIP